MTNPGIHIALPVLNESKYLPGLIKNLLQQDFQDFHLVVCVNNSEKWWDDPEKKQWCYDNLESLAFLKTVTGCNMTVIDHSSVGKGFLGKKTGVGMARKTAMDRIAEQAPENDLIVSMDADTGYPENYLSSVRDSLLGNRGVHGLSVPYYHQLAHDKTDRLILRYEIYMRYYLLNMMRIKNPYAFTALGSALAVPVWAYKKSGGMAPVKSGEDFYFLQKLAKTGKIALWADTTAFPSPRFSQRVFFGTGPALIKGDAGDWKSYPVYSPSSFDKVKETFSLFPGLFSGDIQTPMDPFLQEIFQARDIWSGFRKNYTDRDNFIRACQTKTDALRILQFLRYEQQQKNMSDDKTLADFMLSFWDNKMPLKVKQELTRLDFTKTPVSGLNKIRDFLFHEENRLRKEHLSGV